MVQATTNPPIYLVDQAPDPAQWMIGRHALLLGDMAEEGIRLTIITTMTTEVVSL